MKVKELIEELKKCDPEIFVMLSTKGKSGFLSGVHAVFWDGKNGACGVAPCLSDNFTSPEIQERKAKAKQLIQSMKESVLND